MNNPLEPSGDGLIVVDRVAGCRQHTKLLAKMACSYVLYRAQFTRLVKGLRLGCFIGCLVELGHHVTWLIREKIPTTCKDHPSI